MGGAIQSLWVGDRLGLIPWLSISSFLRQGHDYHLYCYGPMAGVPTGCRLRDAREILPAAAVFCYERGPGRGSVSAFSNLFRYKLLLDKGGWWVDADVVCLRPFDFPEPIVFASEHTPEASQVASAVIRLPRGHAVARLCYEWARRQDRRALEWGETGPQLLGAAVRANVLGDWVKGTGVFCAIPWWEWESVLSDWDIPGRSALPAESYGLHLWHEMWRRAGADRLTQPPAGSLLARLWEQYAAGFPGAEAA
jgi:hypothetical protein